MPQAIPVLMKAGAAIGSILFPASGASIGMKIASVAAWTALSVGTNALIASQRSFPRQGSMLDAGVQPDMPRRWQIGRRANAGIFVDWFTNGHKNQNLWAIFYLGEGPMGPLRRIISDGRVVWSGTLTHGNSVRLTEFDSPDERLRIHYMDGRVGQTVNAALDAEFAAVNANYKGTGCAYVIVEATWDPDTVPRVPVLTYETDGAMLYDRSKDSTNGGTGTHRLTDPSTWEVSTNPAVALDHFLLGNYWPGLTRPRLGVGLDPADVPYDRFIAQRTLCNESVTVAGGTQTRYEANGFIQADQIHADVITELCKAMDARPADFGGAVSFISHDAKTSILTITDDDVVEGVPETYQPKRSYGELVGSAGGMYQDPNNNFQPTEYPPVEDAQWVTEDGGVTRRSDFSLPFETNSARAQRLARLHVLRERRQAILSGLYLPRVLELEEGDWFTRQGDRFPSGKVFEVVSPPQLNPNTMEVMMTAIEVDPSDSAWNHVTDEQAQDTPTGDANNSPPPIPVPVVTFATYNYSFGDYNFSSCRFNHTEWNLGPVDIDIEIDESDGAGSPLGNNRQQDFKIPANQQYVSVTSLLPGKQYVVRVRARAGLRMSAWSSWDQFTAGATAQYGAVGTNGATIGTDLFLADGVTVATEPLVVTAQGQAASILGQGALALANDVDWGSTVTGRPVELTDGRVGAGLASNGDLGRPIPSTIKLSSDIMSYLGGGTFIGDLNADLTSANQAASFLNQGSLAVRNDVTWVTDFAAYPGNAAVITAQGQAASILNQGWAATASQDATDNLRAGIGVNSLQDTKFRDAIVDANNFWGRTGNGATLSSSVLTVSSYHRAARLSFSNSTIGTGWQGIAAGFENWVQCRSGDRMGAAGFVGQTGINPSQLFVTFIFYNDSGGYLYEQSVSIDASGGGGNQFINYRKFSALSNQITNPNVAQCRMRVFGYAAATSGTIDVIMPTLAVMRGDAVTGPTPSHGADIAQGGADVTGSNQAASIAGQGPFATSALTEANVLDPLGMVGPLNSNPFFTDPRDFSLAADQGVPPKWLDWVNGGTFTRSTPRVSSSAPAIYNDAAVNVVGGNLGIQVFDTANLQMIAGKKYKVRLTMRRTGGDYNGVGVYLNPRDSSNNSLTSAFRLCCSTLPATNGVTSAFHDGITTWEAIYEMPTNTVSGKMYLMYSWNAMPGYDGSPDFQGHCLECSVQEVTEAERRTDTQTDNADETGANQAASIANQGGQATANATRGSLASRPASPPESSWYVETDNNKLQFYTGGSWYDVADVTPAGAGSPLSATISPAYADGARFGAGTATTNNVTVSVSGGVGPFTFLWEYPPSSGIGISPSLTAATVNFQKSLGTNEHVQTTATVTVTDTGDGNKTVQAQVPINLIAL